jgi:hypothetical protein
MLEYFLARMRGTVEVLIPSIYLWERGYLFWKSSPPEISISYGYGTIMPQSLHEPNSFGSNTSLSLTVTELKLGQLTLWRGKNVAPYISEATGAGVTCYSSIPLLLPPFPLLHWSQLIPQLASSVENRSSSIDWVQLFWWRQSLRVCLFGLWLKKNCCGLWAVKKQKFVCLKTAVKVAFFKISNFRLEK